MPKHVTHVLDMDDLPRAVDEVMLKDLECPVCMEYMVPPIKLCTNGHNICNRCRERVQRCPTCRGKFLDIRCLALENIARRQKHACTNRQNGCLELFSIEHIANHRTACVYGKIKCPLHLSSLRKCPWTGLKNDLKQHVKEAHPDYLSELSLFRTSTLGFSLRIVACFGELFTYHTQKKCGRYYAAVQMIGTSSDASKYKFEFTLLAANGIEQISKTLFVRGYSEDFETIFNSGKCFKLDENDVENFVEQNKLNLTVTLSRV